MTTDAFMPVRGDWITIDALAAGAPQALAAELTALGAQNVAVAGRLVSAQFPIAAIPSLETLPSLTFARPAYRLLRAGAITSQGDGAMRSNLTRNTFGIDGSGVSVGVLSDSFNCLGGASSDTASGDLPATVTVVQDSFSHCTDEGRAMLQIVHDIAPGASLAFATAEGGQASFATNIRALQTAGAKVIVDDVMYLHEPMFQDGVVAQAVDEVVAAGASYFSAAGNDGRNGYTQAFIPGTLPANFIPDPAFLGGTPHKFGSTSLQSLSVPGQSDFIVVLQWDSPFASVSGPPGAQNALDFYLLVPDGLGHLVLVAAATSDSLTSGDPVTLFGIGCLAPPGSRCTGSIMIVNRTGSTPGRFKYVVFPSGGNPVTSPALNSGTIYGHANAAGAMAVGASFFNTPLTVEPYSSAGTTPILFDAGGNAVLDPRAFKPDFVAPDGGDTTFFGVDVDGNGFPNFFGTSAAAPHAAGVVALMLEARPTLTPDDVRATLRQTAINMGAVGFDTSSGFGLIQADRALNGLHQFVITTGPTAAPTSVGPMGAVTLSVTASDNFGHTLAYAWSALCTGLVSNGVFDDVTAQAPTWMAPANTTGAAKTCSIKVIVNDGHGFPRSNSVTVTVRSAPKITLLTPAFGPVGTVVTITGLSLGNVTDVTFSPSQTVPATVVSPTSVRANVPAGAQTGVVRLTSPDGTGTSLGVFRVTPKITNFTPASGLVTETVTINGFNLQVGSALPTVKLGGGAATVEAATPTQVTARIQGTSLSGRISLTTTDGTGASATDFIVIRPPTIGALTPASGPVGSTVTITGTNLNSVTDVKFFNEIGTVPSTIVSATSIGVAVPAGATTGKISVVTRAGTAQSLAAFKVSPRIDDVAPLTVVAGTDTVITITGVNLRAATGTPMVKVGAFIIPVASVLSAADTQIQFKVPLGAVTGKVSVMTVDGPGVSAAVLTVHQPPKVTAVTPSTTTVGSMLTVTGTNLANATMVTFTPGVAAVPTAVTPTSLRVGVPAGVQTGPITVTNSIGTGIGPTVKLVPKITGFTPASALASESVTINGFNLNVGAVDPTVRIGAVVAPATASTDTSVTATVPATASTGKISVMTADGSGISATDFIVIKPPTITAFTPGSGPVGTVVTITGTNLNSVTDIHFFNDVSATFNILSSTSIRATVPAGAITGKISVTNRAGTAQSVAAFRMTPRINSFTPASALPGEGVTISGFNFKIGITDPIVKVGAVRAEDTGASSDTSVTVRIPPTAVTGKISVTTVDGNGTAATATSAADFIVIRLPSAMSFTPVSGPVGTAVTITGTNLNSVTAVGFNGTRASEFTILTPTSIRAVVPPGATTGEIGVTNRAGTGFNVNVFRVTPKITDFTPASGLAGNQVTINGFNLRVGGATPIVKLGTGPAQVISATSTSITAAILETSLRGKITVTTTDGTGISATDFVVIKPATITAVTPASGPVGTTVMITGTNLDSVTEVTLDGVSLPDFTVLGPTSLRVVISAGALTAQLGVSNPAGGGLSAGVFKVTPKIDGFTPTTGPAGTSVTISGLNLKDGPADPTVKIGGIVAPITVGATDTSVTITVPATAITGKISVTTSAGTGMSTGNFVVIKPPTITGITPTSGEVGALVTITGANLSAVTNVTFNGIEAPGFTIVSATSIKINAPPGASTGRITVTNPATTAQSAGNFTVLP